MENTRKISLAAVLIATLALVLVAYAVVTLKTITQQMTVPEIEALSFEVPIGTPVTSYDWGSFDTIGIAKQETFWIRNIGNTPLTINLSLAGLPSGWSFTLSQSEWSLSVGETKNFTASLQLLEAVSSGSYGFTLDFQTS